MNNIVRFQRPDVVKGVLESTLDAFVELQNLSDEEREQRKMMWQLQQRLNAEGDTEGDW